MKQKPFPGATSVVAERRRKYFGGKKMTTQQNDFSVLKEKISQNNVLTMAEFIALMETRFLVGYMGSRMQKMYADLFADIKHKHEL